MSLRLLSLRTTVPRCYAGVTSNLLALPGSLFQILCSMLLGAFMGTFLRGYLASARHFVLCRLFSVLLDSSRLFSVLDLHEPSPRLTTLSISRPTLDSRCHNRFNKHDSPQSDSQRIRWHRDDIRSDDIRSDDIRSDTRRDFRVTISTKNSRFQGHSISRCHSEIHHVNSWFKFEICFTTSNTREHLTQTCNTLKATDVPLSLVTRGFF